MSCCNNTYNLGCYDSCSNLSIGVAEVSGTYKGIFTSGNNRITQTITVISGQPFVFDLRELNESATYSLSIYRNGVLQEITIDDIEYDCFSFKTQILGLDNTVTPIQGCTPFCQEIGIFTDETLSGKGTELNPLSVVGGGGGSSVWGGITGTLSNQIDLQNALNAKEDTINKTDTVIGNTSSSTKFASIKGMFDWIMSLGFITNVITALGYTPESVANKQTDLTSSATKYPTVNAVNTGLALKVTANSAITGATKTKITYDSKGLVTGGVDASLSELLDDATHRTVTDAQIAAWNALIGGSVFQTVWNATTNSPSLVSSVGTKGFYYIVNVSGSTNLNGITDWKVGDWAIFDGTVWRKVDNTDAVSDVNGLTGSVVLDTSNVSATLNKRYVTDAQLVIIGNTSGTNSGDNSVNSLYSGLATSKQDTLVSGTNIKTINGTSLLGSGNIAVGASLSDLIAATSANTINNSAFLQEWQWNSLTSGNGLKLSSSSTGASGNSQSILLIEQTGINADTSQITFGAIISNTKTGATSKSIALKLLNNGSGESLRMQSTASLVQNYLTYYNSSNTLTAEIGHTNSAATTYFYINSYLESIIFKVSNIERFRLGADGVNTSANYINVTSPNLISYSGTGRFFSTNGDEYSFQANNAGSSAYFGALSGNRGCLRTTGGQAIIWNNNQQVSINQNTVNASAQFQVDSVTRGVLLPRMTTTQKNAIASPAEGLEVYDLTLHQKSYYNGTTWINY